MVKKSLVIMILTIFMACGLHAEVFNKAATNEVELIQKGETKGYCPVCGMNIKQYYKTSHGVVLNDGVMKHYCSLRCLAVDWPLIEGNVKQVLVVDVKSEKLIDTKSAFYVVGSNVPGTMSTVSKLAFANETDAKAFIAQNGGEIMNFEGAFSRAKASLKEDIDTFVQKKQKGMYPMGEKIYHAQCPKDAIHLHDFQTIAELKVNLKTTNLCGALDEKELQALSLYLWEVVRLDAHHHEHKTVLHVEKDEKCPVCGMFAHKYPKWASRMNYTENNKSKSYAFDGVKDMLKFYHNPSKWGNYIKPKVEDVQLLVSDYYTQEVIDGKSAFYVIGSDVNGPMGREFIPFSTLKSAQTFMKDHKGKQVLEFQKIDEALVYAQDH